MLALFPSALRPEREGDPAAKQTLQYGVEWRLIRAGLARLTWSPQPDGMQQADLHLESAGLVSKLYRVNDDYRAMLDKNLCASSVLLNAEEGKRRRETKVSFDGAGKVSYVERDLIKNTVALTKELQTPPCVHEYMGGLRKLRTLGLEPGQSTTVPLTDGKKFASVKVDAQEREQIKTPAGAFSAMRYEVHMFNNVILNRKARMHVWISEDARRLPVQLRVRMSVLVGTITLQLERIE
jgi:hypothetical protein